MKPSKNDRFSVAAALMVALSLSLLSGMVNAQSFAAGSTKSSLLVVGLRQADLKILDETSTSRDQLIARTVQDVLPSYVKRGLEQDPGRRIYVLDQSQRLPSWDVDRVSKTNANVELRVISMGQFGTKVQSAISARVGADTMDAEENLLISSTINYGDLEEKLNDFSNRTWKRLRYFYESLPTADRPDQIRGIIRLDCIVPADPDNRKLVLMARALSLELPLYLNLESSKRDISVLFEGTGYSGAPCENQQQQEARDREQYRGYQISGTLTSKLIGGPSLLVRINDPKVFGNFRRILETDLSDISNESLSRAAAQLMDNLMGSR